MLETPLPDLFAVVRSCLAVEEESQSPNYKVLPKSIKKIPAGKNSARTSFTSDLLYQQFQCILFDLSTILADAEDSYSIILLISPSAFLGALI